MSEGLTAEEVHETVDRAVAELLEAARVSGPPVDALTLAQRHLRLVLRPNRDRARRGRKQVSVRPEPTEEARQWLAAQEIGEHQKVALALRLGVAAGRAGASLVNLFARRLLVPTRWLTEEARACGHALPDLKERFASASHEMIAWRLLDLGEPCVITIVDNDAVHARRSNAWPVRRELAPAERECQRQVSRYSRPYVVNAKGWTVQGWPIHQADWKREVLRSVIEEDTEMG